MPRAEHIPLELLETFVEIAEREGDAAAAGQVLDISQPTVSKRLAALRRLTSDPDGEPWLLLKGKRWNLTTEGQRVFDVVADLVRRHQQMESFVRGQQSGRPTVSIACGQQAASGFVRTAVQQFLKQHSECQIRVSTPRGKTRIEGVAGGQYDMAIVTDSPTTIQRVAGMELYVESLFDDDLILVANPSARSLWKQQWQNIVDAPTVRAKDLIGLPLVLPESDASRRRQFDEWIGQATSQQIDVVLETGGWQNILAFVVGGLGVGIVPQSSFALTDVNVKKVVTRSLSNRPFPAESVSLITRKAHGRDEAELSASSRAFLDVLREVINVN